MLEAQKAGCYGIVAGNNDYQQEIELPLKKLTYDVELSQCLAYLQTQQIYFNQSTKILDVQYVFPVYPNAAIVNFQVSFGGHTSKGIVKSKEQAEKEYKQNLDEGREVGYGGYYNQMSKDVMKIKLGNINPNEEIKVKICYVHTVGVAYNTFYEFRLSTTITPRYVSRAAVENQVQFVNNKAKNVSGKCVWFLNIKIKSKRQLKKFFSTTHKIGGADRLDLITYRINVNETNMKPDRDFNLYYTFQNFDKPVCMLGQSDHVTQAIVSFVPKFCNLELGDAERRAIQNKQYPVAMSKTKGEYIFFLDRSGSMGGERITKAKEALIIFLKSLPVNSYFNIVSFGNQSQLLFSQSQKYQTKSINQTLEKVKQMDADMGGTQILEAIKRSMELPLIPDYTRQIFLLTDGSVSNTSSVVGYAGLHTQFTRYHCIGIGDGCSQDLIINCAEKGKGYHMFISDQEDPSEKIVQILEKSLSPVISKMNVQISGGVQSVVPNPEKLPYILKNQLANFYITFNGKLTNNVTVTIKYSDSLGQNYLQKVDISPSNALVCSYINKMVSFTAINTLYNIYKYKEKTEEHMFFVKEIKKEELANQIIKESVDKQILTELTAFICIDSSKADEITKSHLKNQKETVNINPMNPADHVLHVNFGASFDDYDSDSDQYIDECCVVEMVMPQSVSESKPHFNFKKLNDPKFLVIDRSSKDGVKKFSIPQKKDLPKQLLQFIEKQQLNGVWNFDEFLRRVYSDNEVEVIKRVFYSYPKEIWVTLAIIKNIELFFKDKMKKASLILRKAREYIDNNCSQKYEQLQARWNAEVRKQELSTL